MIAEAQLAYRRSILPIQLAAARATLLHLEAEARRLGVLDVTPHVPTIPPGRNGAAANAPSAAAPTLSILGREGH